MPLSPQLFMPKVLNLSGCNETGARFPDKDTRLIPEGTFLMGSDGHYPEEGPTHSVNVQRFWIDKYAVTNEQFSMFVDATGYVTLAERPPKAEDYPGAKPELLLPASVVFKNLHTALICAATTTGGLTFLEQIGDIPKVLKARSRIGPNIPSFTLHMKMLRPMQNG
jgi:hypothetical protein